MCAVCFWLASAQIVCMNESIPQAICKSIGSASNVNFHVPNSDNSDPAWHSETNATRNYFWKGLKNTESTTTQTLAVSANSSCKRCTASGNPGGKALQPKNRSVCALFFKSFTAFWSGGPPMEIQPLLLASIL